GCHECEESIYVQDRRSANGHHAAGRRRAGLRMRSSYGRRYLACVTTRAISLGRSHDRVEAKEPGRERPVKAVSRRSRSRTAQAQTGVPSGSGARSDHGSNCVNRRPKLSFFYTLCHVTASTPKPEGGAWCVSSARRDLCRGRGAILVLTATMSVHSALVFCSPRPPPSTVAWTQIAPGRCTTLR